MLQLELKAGFASYQLQKQRAGRRQEKNSQREREAKCVLRERLCRSTSKLLTSILGAAVAAGAVGDADAVEAWVLVAQVLQSPRYDRPREQTLGRGHT